MKTKKQTQKETAAEKALRLRCYRAGMRNDWASGRMNEADGNPLVEEDRLNPHSVFIVRTLAKLKKVLSCGAMLGTGAIYKNLFFLQQIDGGDEWAVYEITPTEINKFESVTFGGIIERGEFAEFVRRLSFGAVDYWTGQVTKA